MAIIINSATGKEISADSIRVQDKDGVVLTDSKCWKYIPDEYLETKPEFATNEYYGHEKSPEYNLSVKTLPFNESVNNIEKSYTEKAKYFFGLKGLCFSSRHYEKNSGILSDYIDVGDAKHITVSAAVIEGVNSSVEFYVIDGITEVPIKTDNNRAVVQEKLFYSMNTRFNIDYSRRIDLFEDGIMTAKNYLDLTYDDFEKHEYCLSYSAAGECFSYVPINNNIRIKAVIRCFGKQYKPLQIKSVTVNKHGSTPSWN